MVRIHLGPLLNKQQYGIIKYQHGGLAQLGERLLCTQEVSGSIPLFSIVS